MTFKYDSCRHKIQRKHERVSVKANLRRHAVDIEVGGLLGLIILILDVWAIVKVFGSSASDGKKVLWVVVILLLPVIGFLAWLLIGPKSG